MITILNKCSAFVIKKPHVNLRKKVSEVRRRGYCPNKEKIMVKETSLRKMCQVASLGEMGFQKFISNR